MDEGVIHQTLHGYRQGHRLLAGGAALTEEERGVLLALSDLSGYLPHGLDFTRYHSGFPCGRFYAFACTWPDAFAQRGGTVVTHTLLIPPALLAAQADPFALTALHHSPGLDVGLSRYDAPLAAPGVDAPPAQPEEARARAALVLLFGQQERPILFCEERPPEDMVAYLWALLWPRARAAFSFCTLALQARQHGKTPFTFLGVPPAARGAFFELQRSNAWWELGRLREPMAARLVQPLFTRLLQDGCSPIVARAASEGLRPPELVEVPLLARYQELAERAPQILTAAVARADLLARYQPEPTCPAWPAVLRDLLRGQTQAPVTPRPLFYLTDLCARPQLAFLAALDGELHAHMAALLAAELPARLRAAPDAAEDLPLLLRGRGVGPFTDALVAAIAGLLNDQEGRPGHTVGDLSTQEVGLRCTAVLLSQDDASPLERQVTAALLRGCSSAALEVLVAKLRERGGSGMVHAAEFARSERLPLLLFLSVAQDDGGLGALREAAQLLMVDYRGGSALLPSDDPALDDAGRTVLREMLSRCSPEARLRFTLDAAPAVVEEALQAAQAALRELSAVPKDWLDQMATTPAGAALLCRLLPERSLAAAVRQRPALARAVLALALQDAALPVSEWLPEDIAESDLLQVAPPAEIVQSRMAQRYLTRAASAVFRRLLRCEMIPAEAAAWLRSPVLHRHLQDAHPWDISRGAQSDQEQGGAQLFKALQQALHDDVLVTGGWVTRFQDAAFDSLSRVQLAAALPDWCRFFAMPIDAPLRQTLAIGAFKVVVAEKPPNGHLVMERVFTLLYSEIVKGHGVTYRGLLGYPRWNWDYGKTWRHWLLDTYLAEQWPAVSLVQATGQDDKLLGQVLARADRSERGCALRNSLKQWAQEGADKDPERARTLRVLMEGKRSR